MPKTEIVYDKTEEENLSAALLDCENYLEGGMFKKGSFLKVLKDIHTAFFDESSENFVADEKKKLSTLRFSLEMMIGIEGYYPSLAIFYAAQGKWEKFGENKEILRIKTLLEQK